MEALSVFDMLKIGVGPSSSHTLGPWRAVQRWLRDLASELGALGVVEAIEVHLYGSLALTGRGHATDRAIMLALLGHEPETVDVAAIPAIVRSLEEQRSVALGTGGRARFDPAADIVFHPDERLAGHPNAMTCIARVGHDEMTATYYSIGGGFVVAEHDRDDDRAPVVALPFPAQQPEQLRRHCIDRGARVADIVWQNEQAWRSPGEIRTGLRDIWRVMAAGAYRGCHTEGVLPGGLGVRRRAAPMARRLLGADDAESVDGWIDLIRSKEFTFSEVLEWVGAFAMGVNEENASLGRIVTAPTNGAAGVIPAVLLHHVCFSARAVSEQDVFDFLLVAGEIGTLFKKGATISAAMGGCQAEVGVSSAMAAAALTEALGGTVDQSFMAAEIAMEHHLGMTCDPVAGLVQVPCIERNTMGAVKAITAAHLALAGNPADARVSLDEVIRTLQATAEDMSDRYKETSRGGLAVNVSVRLPEC